MASEQVRDELSYLVFTGSVYTFCTLRYRASRRRLFALLQIVLYRLIHTVTRLADSMEKDARKEAEGTEKPPCMHHTAHLSPAYRIM